MLSLASRGRASFNIMTVEGGVTKVGLYLGHNLALIRPWYYHSYVIVYIFDEYAEAYKIRNNENRTIKQNIKARISRTLSKKGIVKQQIP